MKRQKIITYNICSYLLLLLSFTYLHGKMGCTDDSACNYDSTATDNAGCRWLDCESGCTCLNSENTNSCAVKIDCTGECGGNALVDDCNVCEGPGKDVECWDGSYVCDNIYCPATIPEIFQSATEVQSLSQASYSFYSVTINGMAIEAADWVGAFNGDICVGARQWDTSLCVGGVCDVPVMGYYSLDDNTEGYCNTGDTPTFKIYDASANVYLDAVASVIIPWEKNNNPYIDHLEAFTDLSAIGTGHLFADNYYISNIYPNPFNPIISIEYSIPENSNIKLIVYNIHGRIMQTLVQSFHTAGFHSINWNASNYPSGVYLIRLEHISNSTVKKVVLFK